MRKSMDKPDIMAPAGFMAARQQLLQNQTSALDSYVQGIAAVSALAPVRRQELFSAEEDWVRRAIGSGSPSELFDWALRLLQHAHPVPGMGPKATALNEDIPVPVLIVAGGVKTLNDDDLHNLTNMLALAFSGLRGTVISGGTDGGVPGCVGAATAVQGQKRSFKLIGVRPEHLPAGVRADSRYDLAISAGRDRFSLTQVLHYWEMLSAAGVPPAEVRLLGYGGGTISAFEYRLALALGGIVGVVEGSGAAAEALLNDPFWRCLPNLFALSCNGKTLQDFIHGQLQETTPP
ncbi:MAG: hypothetical protein GX564_04010 [Oligosphaeraceae bacterium]|nr:hypothetical protein [Oligosphaeraceae bacterium]